MKLEKKDLQADVLVVGGGLAGCMAAIRASELVGGENVLVVEKGNVRRSGNAATGIDHTWSYMPEIHDPLGFTPEQLVEDHTGKLGPLQDQDLIHTIAATISDRIREMEGWGFPFKTNGEYRYVKKIHRVPSFLHWAGRDQKVLFTKELKKRGIRVLNRVLGTEILKEDGNVAGVLGISTRNPLFYVLQAKAVVLTTGGISRIYPGITSMDFSRQRYPYGTGDGIAMSYRAGAEVTRLEFNTRWSGAKSYVKPGRGTWIGVMEDVNGNPLTGVRAKADRGKVDMAVESPADMIRAYMEGRGPIYMNCTDISDEDFAYMKWGLSNEGNLLMLEYMKQAGIDPQQNRIEFTFYEPELTGGLVINAKGETNVKGLFAAGGEVIGNIKRAVSPGSFALGWITGETAARHSREMEFGSLKISSEFIEEKTGFYSEILKRREGASWKEVCGACQDIMGYYGGEIRYETLLKTGIANLGKIRQRARDTLMAHNSHELVRCLESFNLMDIGEASMLSALERKETRLNQYDPFVRVDYPEENKDMNQFLLLRIKDGKPCFKWRTPRKII